MLTAENIVAKVVVSVVSKVASALAAMATDKRKKAARALLKLYYAVQSLDEASEQLLLEIPNPESHGAAHALIVALVSNQDRIEIATNAFVDLASELQRGLSIIDPALAQVCAVIYRGKGDFLSFMSQSIDLNLRGDKALVTLYCPNPKILATDFEEAYSLSQNAIARGETYYWPTGAFDYFNDFEEVVLSSDDDTAAINIIAMIRQHHELLRQAKEQLRSLIKESFSVDELLFHEDMTPK
jgi:hypothetical protein